MLWPWCGAAERYTEEHLDKQVNACLLHGEGVGGHTFAGGGATVVFKVGAVFTLVVLWASAVVVRGQVEAQCSVLTRVGGAVIDVQLRQK